MCIFLTTIHMSTRPEGILNLDKILLSMTVNDIECQSSGILFLLQT